ncbi:MAG TPA: bifunctional diaminohydroxyphosphoribosylaminopyrimidine deaminase/5-amino-6-(5-phosphoribosylamino)uracil reductase RibD [Stellaceae bacterium]|nr:bifunctional diaminohydroxyphosphoribosylaminopyrimidine deaminase/5-amino-6-(5-phosphoribosylamino)uracil reductase RibD [Stellaceae bacterium]
MATVEAATGTPANDLAHMRAALGLARRGLGNTWPNPAVGCVIVKGGRVVSRGWTQPGGRPHAEELALQRAGSEAKGATAYVTLEPCSLPGRGPACADGLIAAGVARVIAPVEDRFPRVAGTGFAKLRAAGIEVEVGLCADEANEINAGFFARVKHRRPLVTLKLATSLDGRIATASGESRWITGRAARERAHLLRATHDAVLVGTGTALADDPQLTCRLPGLESRSPVRIVIDRHLRLPANLRLFAEADQAPTWVATLASADPARQAALAKAGVKIVATGPNAAGGIDLADLLLRLGDEGLTRLLVEGGGQLAAALLRASLIDRLVWMRAPLVIGGDGLPAVAALDRAGLAGAPRFTLLSSETAGGDLLEIYRRAG